MMSMKACILFVAIFASMTLSTYAIKCYQCESITNSKCGVNFEEDDSIKFDCSRIAPPRFLQTFLPVRNATGCMKKTIEGVNGHNEIVRSCYFGDLSNTQTGCQSDPTLPFVRQLSCDVCKDNLCNSSGAIAPIAVTLSIFFALARLLS